MYKRNLAALAAAGMLMGCAGTIGDARMRTVAAPDGSLDQVAVTGIGGKRQGTLRMGETHGEYRRGSSRLGLFGYGSRTGDAGFSVAGGDLAAPVRADCHSGQGDLGVGGGVRVTVRPMTLRCRFMRGAQVMGELELFERGTLRDARAGTLRYGDTDLEIQSVHRMRGTSLPSQTPIGYVFLAQGREIGGIDLNGGTKQIFLPRDPAQREAATAGGLALAVFWDPQVVAPD